MERILDSEHQELEERLLRAGKDVYMSPALRAKTLAAIAAGTVGVTAATTAKAGAMGSLASKGGVAWGAVSLIGGAGVVGAAIVASATWSSPAPPPSDQEPERAELTTAVDGHSAPVLDPLDAPEDESEPAVELDLSDLADEEAGDEKPRPGVTQVRKSTGAQRSPSAGSSTLGEELAHIARVEAALKAGRASSALSLLQEYRRRFAAPQLGLEAEVLTIQALHENGSLSAARSRASAFVERYPKSPLGVRAKQYLK